MNHRFTYRDTKSNPTSLWSSRYWQLDLFGRGTWDPTWDIRVWGSVCDWGACDDLLLQLTYAFHPHVQMYWPLNSICYPTTSCTTCALCTSRVPHLYDICTTSVPHVLLAHAFATFHPIVKGLQCDTNAIVMKEQHVHFHNSWTSTILRWAAQVQPNVSCVSWNVQVLLELVILVWCAHVVYCLAESSGYTVLLGGYGDTSTQ